MPSCLESFLGRVRGMRVLGFRVCGFWFGDVAGFSKPWLLESHSLGPP